MRLDRIKIMVVDDDPDIRELMTMALESEGAVVSQAVDGNDAINVFKTTEPEVVVLDMMLPHRSGFLVLEHIQTTEAPPPVIMVTANEGRRHKGYAESLGVSAYLNKPVAMASLLDTVLEQLSD